MPLYDYVCSNCGHLMEVSHSIHGHGPATCPECGGPMKKAISVPAVHYKGTGWARKESSSRARASRTKESEASSDGSSDAGSSDAGSSTAADPTPARPDSAAS